MGTLRQFGLLLWKNYVLQKRKVFVTLLEIGLPAMFALLLIEIRHITESTLHPNITTWSKCNGVNAFPTPGREGNVELPSRLCYFPENNETRTIMNLVQSELRLQEVRGFPAEEEMVTFLMSNGTDKTLNNYLGGVGFTSRFEDGKFTDSITFKIRLTSYPRHVKNQRFRLNPFLMDTSWKTNLMFPIFQKIGPRDDEYTCGYDPGYGQEGFLAVQTAVSKALFAHLSPPDRQELVSDMMLELERHPYPPYNDDNFVLVIQKQFPLIIMLSFVITALNIVKDVVHEKERKLKEYMKMMGLSSWLHWSAWFIKYLLFMAISVFLMTLFYCIHVDKQGSVVGQTHPTILFVFLLVYSIASISFCFAVSVFFSRANSAAAAGGILFFCSYIPYFFIQPRYEQLSWGEKIAGCLDFNIAMAFGGQIIGMFEGTGYGVQWSNINTGVSVDDDFTMLQVLLMLLLDTVIYGLIAWYVEAVFPGEYGVPQPWYFPFLASYWCGTAPSDRESQEIELGDGQTAEFFERDPSGLKAGIQIRNLRKVFGKGSSAKVAVSGMELNMYEGQITALLGHNGAGKTTTMSMLTGFLPPSSGTAIVNGFDIREDLSSVRSSLGLCPQHDVLFDTLTVEEHLIFFAKLKGLESGRVKGEVEKMLESISLTNKRDALAKTLSGGMKRRLSIGIALIADSKVVILDEPSSGLDPDARRHIWTVLQNNQAGRTLLLTTHYMDEADVLGNRIAIMADGVVKCCGSSLFLKRKYGAGYHMVMVKEANCQVHKVTEVVQSFVPQAALESNVGAELSYVLPQESTAQFEGLFLKLQEEQQSLGISSFGASITTMEEVFLKVGGEDHHSLGERLRKAAIHAVADGSLTESALAETAGPSNATSVNGLSVPRASRTEVKHNTGLKRYLQQLYAMFLKRVLHTVRNILVTATQLGIPLFFTIMALIVVKTFPGPEDAVPLNLTINNFGLNYVPYSTPPNATSQFKPLTDAYVRQFAGTNTKITHVNDKSGFKNDSNLISYLAKRGEEGIGQYNLRYMVAADFVSRGPNKSSVVAFFNNQAYHSPAISLAQAAAAMLQFLTNNPKLSLLAVNHPLPRTNTDKVNDQITQGTTGFTIAFNVVFGMAFLSSSFALFLVRERTVKAKHLQVVSGVHPLTFWLATFLWDLVNFLLPCLLLLLTFLAFDIQPFLQDGHWAHILLLFFMYGWGMLPFVYLASFLFTVPSTAFVWITMFNIISGVACLLVVGILSVPQLQLLDTAHLLEWIFLVLLPNFCLGQGLSDYYSNHEFLQLCEPFMELCPFVPPSYQNVSCCPGRCGNVCIDFNKDYLSWQPGGIGRMLVFLGVQGLVYFGAIFLLELRLPQRLLYLLRSCLGARQERPALVHRQESLVQEDEDVARERSRLAGTPLSELFLSDKLLLQEVSKWYNSFLAVDQLSVGIPHGECFGLLGINGAGKTTTFKMLTGDEMLSSGEAYLDGFSVKSDISKVQQRLGYCPQFDALIDQLTGRETLFLYGRLRGVREDILPNVVQELVDSLTLTEYADREVQTYSGGNKRKLSTGIALVGDPPIVFLDEPTTGMDPVARRLLWNTLSAVRDSGRTLVLTSHSMEECEALCTRLAIMVNGQFRCLGSQQHLKSKFGQGYTLLARVAAPSQGSPDLQPLQAFMERTFPGSVLKDTHQCSVHFHITDASLSWAHIFGTLERAKTELGIEDYLVSQTTLEQVFIFFAQGQRPPADPSSHCCGNHCFSWCCRSSSGSSSSYEVLMED